LSAHFSAQAWLFDGNLPEIRVNRGGSNSGNQTEKEDEANGF